MGIKHQLADTLLSQKTTGPIRQQSWTKYRCYASLPPFPENQEAKDMYMQNGDVLKSKEGIGLYALHGIATYTDIEHDERLISAQELPQEEAND